MKRWLSLKVKSCLLALILSQIVQVFPYSVGRLAFEWRGLHETCHEYWYGRSHKYAVNVPLEHSQQIIPSTMLSIAEEPERSRRLIAIAVDFAPPSACLIELAAEANQPVQPIQLLIMELDLVKYEREQEFVNTELAKYAKECTDLQEAIDTHERKEGFEPDQIVLLRAQARGHLARLETESKSCALKVSEQKKKVRAMKDIVNLLDEFAAEAATGKKAQLASMHEVVNAFNEFAVEGADDQPDNSASDDKHLSVEAKESLTDDDKDHASVGTKHHPLIDDKEEHPSIEA